MVAGMVGGLRPGPPDTMARPPPEGPVDGQGDEADGRLVPGLARPAHGHVGLPPAGEDVDERREDRRHARRRAVDQSAAGQDGPHAVGGHALVDVVAPEGDDVEAPGDGPTPGREGEGGQGLGLPPAAAVAPVDPVPRRLVVDEGLRAPPVAPALGRGAHETRDGVGPYRRAVVDDGEGPPEGEGVDGRRPQDGPVGRAARGLGAVGLLGVPGLGRRPRVVAPVEGPDEGRDGAQRRPRVADPPVDAEAVPAKVADGEEGGRVVEVDAAAGARDDEAVALVGGPGPGGGAPDGPEGVDEVLAGPVPPDGRPTGAPEALFAPGPTPRARQLVRGGPEGLGIERSQPAQGVPVQPDRTQEAPTEVHSGLGSRVPGVPDGGGRRERRLRPFGDIEAFGRERTTRATLAAPTLIRGQPSTLIRHRRRRRRYTGPTPTTSPLLSLDARDRTKDVSNTYPSHSCTSHPPTRKSTVPEGYGGNSVCYGQVCRATLVVTSGGCCPTLPF